MKISKTNVQALSKAFDGHPAEAALPARLKDETLHQIARDLRLIELSCTVDDSIEPPLSGPMFLILHMIQEKSRTLPRKTKFEMTEESLQHWLQRYMYYIEREVVARVIGVPDKHDSDRLIFEVIKSL